MTEQEKELVEIMVKEHDNLTNDPRTRKTAQAILQAGYTKNKGEQLEVEITRVLDMSDHYVYEVAIVADTFLDSKQEAIDFCNKFNLKINGEA